MEISPSFPAETVPEFVAYAKAHPGTINCGSGGIGTVQHVAAEMFKSMAGVDMVHVSYKGDGPALTGLIGGQVQVYFGPMPSSIGFINADKLRALAVTTASRAEALPDISPLSKFLPSYEASNWLGIGAPSKTPAEIIEKLNKEINAALADPKFKAQLVDQGNSVLPGSPAAFASFIVEETEKWGHVIQAANIKPE
jgi:tripartite-type tricarboxylate transporter receptor subunit TctC